MDSQKLHLHYVNIGEIGDWGFPTSRNNMSTWLTYSETIWKHGRTADLVLVDGRFRLACALQALYASNFPLDVSFANANQTTPINPRDITIMMHDFANRNHYHKALDYMDVIYCIDTLTVLKPKSTINLDRLRHDILHFRIDPSRN